MGTIYLFLVVNLTLFSLSLSLFVYFWLFVAVWGLSLAAVHGLLIAMTSLVAEQDSRAGGLGSCGTWA